MFGNMVWIKVLEKGLVNIHSNLHYTTIHMHIYCRLDGFRLVKLYWFAKIWLLSGIAMYVINEILNIAINTLW